VFRRRIPDEARVKKLSRKDEEELTEMEEELEQIQEAEDELEEEREGILKRFFRRLWMAGRKEQNEDIVLEEAEQPSIIEEEIKEVLKDIHKWLENLPKDKKAEFRKSEDFRKYKDLLKKLGMIK
jgi:hypothetical protein